jgi:excisionase family DNA binding protein
MNTADACDCPGELRGDRDGMSKTTMHATDREGMVATGSILVRPEALMTFDQAAETLGISLRQFRRLVDSGKVAFVKVSERAPRVRPSELHRFLDASAVKYSEVSP